MLPPALPSSLPPQSPEATAPPIASLGDRFVGELLDTAVMMIILILWALPFAVAGTPPPAGTPVGVMFALVYILFSDALPGGQSLGKRINNTAVVDASTGEPCTLGQSFVRNVVHVLLGVFDWVFIFGRRRQRLGDRAARTVVIKVQRHDD